MAGLACYPISGDDMNQVDDNAQPTDKKTWNRPEMKAWNKPEIRDQSISSATGSKPNQWPSEASPGTGS